MTTPLAQLVYSQWSASRPEFYARWEPERTVCVRLSSGRKTQSQNAAPRGPRVQGKLAPFHRHAATLAAAIALPLIILAGLQLYTQVNAERRKLETDIEAQAANVMRIVDAQLLAEIKVANVLAFAISSEPGDLAAAYALSKQFRAAAGTWRTVRISDAAGVELFDLRKPLGAGSSAASTSVVEFPNHLAVSL